MTIITYYNYDYVLMAIITQPINDSNYVLITTYHVAVKSTTDFHILRACFEIGQDFLKRLRI